VPLSTLEVHKIKHLTNASYLLSGSVVESAITAPRSHYCSCKFHCRIDENPVVLLPHQFIQLTYPSHIKNHFHRNQHHPTNGFCEGHYPGRPVGSIRLLLVFRISFLAFLLPPRLPLVYVLCTMGCAPFALL
jgi:hypothetical protein